MNYTLANIPLWQLIPRNGVAFKGCLADVSVKRRVSILVARDYVITGR